MQRLRKPSRLLRRAILHETKMPLYLTDKSGMQYKIIYDNLPLLRKDIADLGKKPKDAFRVKTKLEEFAMDPL
jgi:hypothetical protein